MTSYSQGVSFSYLIPKNGSLAAPVSPLSVRGVGVNFGFIGVETGISVYNIPGLGMEGLPFESDEALVGPHFATMIPGQLTLTFGSSSMNIKLLAGGFGFIQLFPKINEGNIDRELIAYEGWNVATSNFTMENKPGGGWMGGIEFSVPISQKISIIMGVQYLQGRSSNAISGTYNGGVVGGSIISKTADFQDAQTVFEGIEISLGANFN